MCWTWRMLKPANILSSKKTSVIYIKMQPAADLRLSRGLVLFAGKREDQQRRLKKKITVEVISDSLRKIHKMESRNMTS